MRIGYGYDVHRLEHGGKPLVLAGVRLEGDLGVRSHSDGDVLFHAVTNAVLGAIGMGDIGSHFPDDDARYRDAPSLGFLEAAVAWAREKGFRVVNCDVTVVAERPRLAPRRDEMREALAAALGVGADAANVKFGTGEGVGSVGRGEAVEAHAVVLLKLG